MKVDPGFTPCPVDEDDELYQNGIFIFNITRIIEFINQNPDLFPLHSLYVKDFLKSSSINESHLDSVDPSKPVILAEIAPDRYNLIDGNHRMERARQLGMNKIQAHKLSAIEHVQFLTSTKAYHAYIKYWNDKLRE